jgi:HAD superfamily hydrolase (TIGR01490 family)
MQAAFFDVDGTLTKVRVWMGLMEYFRTRGERRYNRGLFWVYHIPLYISYRLGLIPQTGFRKPWAKHLPWIFRGYTVADAQKIWDWVVKDFLGRQWREDSLTLVENHLSAGDQVILVSASPKPILERIADEIGVSHVIGTEPEVRNGRYTGGIHGPVCIAENKAKMALRYLEDKGIEVELRECYAYADSPGDSHLLEMVGNPVATHPDDELRIMATDRGWKIFPN